MDCRQAEKLVVPYIKDELHMDYDPSKVKQEDNPKETTKKKKNKKNGALLKPRLFYYSAINSFFASSIASDNISN